MFFSPALAAFASSKLSLFVRPFTVGTEIGGSLEAESLPAVDEVLDAVRWVDPGLIAVRAGVDPGLVAATVGCATTDGGAEVVAAVRDVDDATFCESAGTDSPVGAGLASLLAAQASEAPASHKITGKNLYLLNTIAHFSLCG
ncbi:MAG: hypothetical protein ACRENK_01015 [Gemmatimonadaceae bacterium]